MAAGNTYEAIATQTTSSAVASVTFSSISGSYTDLVLVFNGSIATTDSLCLQINGDTATNYSFTRLNGDGSSAASATNANASSIVCYWTGAGKTNVHQSTIQLMNYSNTTTNKTVLIRTAQAGNETSANVALYRSTSAITSIRLFGNSSANIAAGSTFSLYGIAAAT